MSDPLPPARHRFNYGPRSNLVMVALVASPLMIAFAGYQLWTIDGPTKLFVFRRLVVSAEVARAYHLCAAGLFVWVFYLALKKLEPDHIRHNTLVLDPEVLVLSLGGKSAQSARINYAEIREIEGGTATRIDRPRLIIRHCGGELTLEQIHFDSKRVFLTFERLLRQHVGYDTAQKETTDGYF